MKKIISLFALLIFLHLPVVASFYDPGLTRDIVYFPSEKEPGSIVIITADKKLYYLLGDDMAYEFPIAVGKTKKDRFYGTFPVSRKAKWPSWRPTKNMLKKNPALPRVVKGGKRNPLGARALYLGDSAFRIHGTNNPSSIGTAASHGCIRMYNDDVKELYSITRVWDTVYVK